MHWALYILGVVFCAYCLRLGYVQDNLVGGGFWGIVFLGICWWIGAAMEETNATIKRMQDRLPRS